MFVSKLLYTGVVVTSQFIPLVSLVKCGENEEPKTTTLMLCACMCVRACVCVCVCISEVKDGPNKGQSVS